MSKECLPAPCLPAPGRKSPGRTPKGRAASLGVFLGLSLVATVTHADIYQSVGSDGVISFTNSPSKGSKKVAVDEPIAMPRDRSPERYGRYDTFIREAATLYQIPEALIRAVIKAESDFDPRAVSPAGAHGLMQLMPFTADAMMVEDIFDPRQNILGGTRYLRILANMFNGDIHLTVAGYNAGENAVIRYGGIPPYRETQGYVVHVLENYQRYRAEEHARRALEAPPR